MIGRSGVDVDKDADLRMNLTALAPDSLRELQELLTWPQPMLDALTGRRFDGAHDERPFYTGPTRQGVLLQPSAAAELSDLVADAAVKAWTFEDGPISGGVPRR
jgi:hypothetical protein